MSDSIEIEHKYVLATRPDPEVLMRFGEPAKIVQHYLPECPSGAIRRIRSVTKGGKTTYTFTEKFLLTPRGSVENPAAVMNDEFEITLADDVYMKLRADLARASVWKDRWKVRLGDLIFELDHVYSPIDLWVLEVEVDDAERAIDVPAIFGEVVEDPTCSMYAVAHGTYSARS